jgi:Ca2+-binding EF-hand superfamily protein
MTGQDALEKAQSQVIVNAIQSTREAVEEVVGGWGVDSYRHVIKFQGAQKLDGQYNLVVAFDAIFSRPEESKPAPIAVVHVFFSILCSIPEGEAALTAGSDIAPLQVSWRFENESTRHTPSKTLAPGKFEVWLDRIIRDKLKLREVQDLSTDFETSRLAPPGEEEEEESEPSEDSQPEEEHLISFITQDTTGAKTLEERLVSIFDAADEESEGVLSHKEVAELLYATDLQLTDWDIKLLLTTAEEDSGGRIAYEPFVASAPDMVKNLRTRRKMFENDLSARTEVTVEAVELCWGEELEETVKQCKELFDASIEASGSASLVRVAFREALQEKKERFTPQEVNLLMQMVKEDDYGCVAVDEFFQLLVQLRVDALHNAMIENDVRRLRLHLLRVVRDEYPHPEEAQVPIWSLRQVLLKADQILLSRSQVHVMLCLLQPNVHGFVDLEYFLRLACTIIPHFFDTAEFMEKAQAVAKENADEAAAREAEELTGRKARQEEDSDDDDKAPDKEAVEKTLKHAFDMQESGQRSGPGYLGLPGFLAAMKMEMAQSQLSELELRGFIAEAIVDSNNEVQYMEHLKTWIPIIFSMRKSRLYEQILAKEWELVDLSEYEAQHPTWQHGRPTKTEPGQQPDRRRSSGMAGAAPPAAGRGAGQAAGRGGYKRTSTGGE